MSNYYILDGHETKACDLLTWARWFEKADRTVAKDTIGESEVSTVFLGLDHGSSDGSPMLFETLVFGSEHDGEMERYTTWDEAVAGHAAMIDKVRPNI